MNLALHCKRVAGKIRRDMVRTGGDMRTAAANQTGLTRLFLAPPARLELTTFRLGVRPSLLIASQPNTRKPKHLQAFGVFYS